MTATPQYIPPPLQQPPQQPVKSTGCLKWLLAGCSVLLALCIVVFAGIVIFAFGMIKRTDVYRIANDRAIHDPRVIDAVGTPVETGWWVRGSIDAHDGEGSADITFPIHGPKGKATVEARATRDVRAGKWVFTNMKVYPDGGPPIDLLE